MTDFDAIVVGAGIFGSCAAFHCQRLGLKTLLLEQFRLGHSNGSSHGKTRITRYAHTEEAYVPLVADAYKQIGIMEEKRKEQLWRKTGLLWTGMPENIESMAKILKKFGADHSVMKGSEINKQYPQFKYDDTVSALIDPMGGVIYADKWLKAFQEEFVRMGGKIRDQEEMLSFEETEDIVNVQTSKQTYKGKRLILTVGSWIGKLLPQLPLTIEPQSIHVCYWKTKKPEDVEYTDIGTFPVFIGSAIHGHPDMFAMGALDCPNAIKFCVHHGYPLGHGSSHTKAPIQEFVDLPGKYIRDYLPMFESSKPVAVDRCKYTVAEDHHYVIDKAPSSKRVVIGGCGSGSGFKVAPAIGRAVAEIAAGKPTTVDVSFFSLKRFVNGKSGQGILKAKF